jgi:subtilase family serine protease
MTLKQLAASAAGAAVLAAMGLAGGASAQVVTPTAVDASQQVSFKVILPLRNTAALTSLLAAQQTPGNASYHQWLTPAQIAAQFGPTQQTISQVETALTAAGLQISTVHLRSIDVVGTAGQIQTLLQTHLQSIPTSGGDTRIIAATKPIIPTTLSSLGVQVLSFISVRERHVNSKVMLADGEPDNRTSATGGYYYNDMKQAYDYPAYTSATGAGAHVAIVMENTANTSDVQNMFKAQNFLTTTGLTVYPNFTQYYTEDCFTKSGANPTAGLYTSTPAGYTLASGCKFNKNAGSSEAALDTQMVVGGAPGATTGLVTIPDLSDLHITDAYEDIIDSNAYDIVSNSFGGCELDYVPAYNNGYDFTPTLAFYSEIFEIGNLEGITWIFSSGDEAGLECPSIPYMADQTGKLKLAGTFLASVSTPAADPNVTAVGGGNLITKFTKGSLDSTYVGENGAADPEVPYDYYDYGANVTGGYWGAGGGRSQLFAKPAYQSLVNTTSNTRALPDIGMQVGGCPGGISVLPCGPNRSYVEVYIGSTRPSGLIGTSVAAPEFAGALALYEQFHGRQGNINTMLYTALQQQIAAGGSNAPAAKKAYRLNIAGFDGVYTEYANSGYNYIYGNGSPDIRVLFGMLALPAAGVPETASNP